MIGVGEHLKGPVLFPTEVKQENSLDQFRIVLLRVATAFYDATTPTAKRVDRSILYPLILILHVGTI